MDDTEQSTITKPLIVLSLSHVGGRLWISRRLTLPPPFHLLFLDSPSVAAECRRAGGADALGGTLKATHP